MVDIISEVLKVKKYNFRAPMWPFYLLAVVMEKTLSPLGIQPPLHRRRLDFFKKTLFFSPKKSSELLGFKAKTDFKTGSENTVSWYRQQKML